jgi:hypothetical protein
VPDHGRDPDWLERLGADSERTQEFARQLVGLNLHDADHLADRSGYRLRVIRQSGKGLPVTADYVSNRINIEIEDDIVVSAAGVGIG